MTIQYKPFPIDANRNPSTGSPPAAPALQRFFYTSAAVSSVVTLNDNTTVLEVMAGGTPAALRWIASTDTAASVIAIAGTTSNYDVIVPVGVVRRIAIPQERAGVSSVVGLGVQAGLYRRVAWATTGAGSILAAEY